MNQILALDYPLVDMLLNKLAKLSILYIQLEKLPMNVISNV